MLDLRQQHDDEVSNILCTCVQNPSLTLLSHHAHLAHIQRLASTFRRPVTGVHNRTYGPIADVLHTLIHPLLPSTTTIPLTNQIRAALRSPEIKKVIIVTYGTGSLALNTALDTLHADLPMVCMAQLEIYTFGAASRYMQNPLFMLDELSRRDVALPVPQQGERSRSRSPMPHYTRPDGSIASPVKATLKSLGHRVEDMERVIPHIEHYAFAGDMLARCGVLDAVRGGTSKFAGRLFVLNEGDETVPVVAREVKRDYILATFLGKIRSVFDNLKGGIPTQPATTTILPTCGTFNEYMDALFHQTPTTPSCLDTIPIIDTSTAERREFIAQSTIAPIKATRSMSLGLSLHIPNYPSNNTSNYFSHRPSNNHTTNHISSNPFSAHTSATLSPSLSSFDFPPRSRKEKRNSWGTTATLGLDGVGKARQCAREAEGRTVRQLSRLWRFAGGKVPVGEGIPASNGVGVPSVGSPMMNGNNHGLMNAYGTDNGVEETKKRRERKGYNINGGYTTISSPVPAPDSLTQFGLNHDGASEIADGPKSETPPSIEIFKSFKVSMDAPTHEVLPAALKKYNISHPAEEYNLYLAYTEAGVNKERLLERDEKALIIFKDLDRAGIKPMFMLRRTNPLDKETALNTALNGQFTNGVQTNGVQTNGVNSNGVETNGGEKNGHIEAKNGVNGVPAPAGTPVPTTA